MQMGVGLSLNMSFDINLERKLCVIHLLRLKCSQSISKDDTKNMEAHGSCIILKRGYKPIT